MDVNYFYAEKDILPMLLYFLLLFIILLSHMTKYLSKSSSLQSFSLSSKLKLAQTSNYLQ